MTDAVEARPPVTLREPVVGAPGAQVVVISGPSGVGKDTVIDELKKRNAAQRWAFVVTYKSREPRANEVPGVAYHFVTPERFHQLEAEAFFLETASVYEQWSGTPIGPVREAILAGRDPILKLDVQGSFTVRKRIPDALLIFLTAESVEMLRSQLIDRKTESAEQLRIRQDIADWELAQAGKFDYVVVNPANAPAAAADEIERIITTERARHPDRRIRV